MIAFLQAIRVRDGRLGCVRAITPGKAGRDLATATATSWSTASSRPALKEVSRQRVTRVAGAAIPPLRFELASGGDVKLTALARDWLVIYCYPGITDDPGHTTTHEDAREHEAYAESLGLLRRRGVGVVALSSQPLEQQIAVMLDLELQHRFLFDPRLALADALDLPTIEVGHVRFFRRQALLMKAGWIEHVFFPIDDAASGPRRVLAWMLAHGC